MGVYIVIYIQSGVKELAPAAAPPIIYPHRNLLSNRAIETSDHAIAESWAITTTPHQHDSQCDGKRDFMVTADVMSSWESLKHLCQK
jgi:hypothetical protein